MRDKDSVPAESVLTPEAIAALTEVRALAAKSPVDLRQLEHRLKTPRGRAALMRQMERQTAIIRGPVRFLAAYSVEVGHAIGVCRHMSMSIELAGRAPSPEALWMVAEVFGFQGGLDACAVWTDDMEDDMIAVNLVQPVSVHPPSH